MSDRMKDKRVVRIKPMPFEPLRAQVIYYDPQPSSECSEYIKKHLKSIRASLRDLRFNYEFCYLPDMVRKVTKKQVRYRYPNWDGEPLQAVGNDILKPYLSDKDKDLPAGFLHLIEEGKCTFSFYPLKDFSEESLKKQLEYYEDILEDDFLCENRICFSISEPDHGDGEASQYITMEKKFTYDIEADFEQASEKVMHELYSYLRDVRIWGVSEFVLNCAVPVEKRLSRLVVDEKYNIILPDYNDLHIVLGPLPKAIFLLFLKHQEGIAFKCMSDYRDELEQYYRAVTNRVAKSVIESSLDAVTDPLKNMLNEKCSVIKKAFVKHMDEGLAENYCITGKRGQRKRITLPRNLVEWKCEI